MPSQRILDRSVKTLVRHSRFILLAGVASALPLSFAGNTAEATDQIPSQVRHLVVGIEMLNAKGKSAYSAKKCQGLVQFGCGLCARRRTHEDDGNIPRLA